MQRLPLCGGRWNNGSNAGVFNVNLNNPRSNSNSNVGFRSALPSWSDVINPRVYIQYRRVKDPVSVAIAKKTIQHKPRVSILRNPQCFTGS